jgi:CBS domain containing-hemolysin-like protein
MRLAQAAPLVGPEWRGIDRPVGENITLALGRTPEPGEELDLYGLHVEVEAVEGNAVAFVIVGDRPRQEQADE